MAKKKKKPEPIELPALPPAPKMAKARQLFQHNKTTLWRTLQASLLGLLIFLADNGKDYVKAVIEKQKQAAVWQAKGDAFRQASLRNDSTIINQNNLLLTHFKIKPK